MPSNPPTKPQIYHITHMDNLKSISKSGYLYSDARRIEMGLKHVNIAMQDVKDHRPNRSLVGCYPETNVSQYVPFYFCPRSIMLYIYYKGNHSAVEYKGGQEPIIHLQIDMNKAIHWTHGQGLRWAFSDRNASAIYASFYKDLKNLDQINWDSVAATYWQPPEIKEGKQAEFLVYNRVSWDLVEKIGVIDKSHANQVAAIIGNSSHTPEIVVKPSWYY
ncbi:MAG: DUF4433 domain-containing protein [Chloroflexi bacterium]|nr:DUF4433 domain-containing protein [Chloroflexota bacterium]